MQFPSFKEHKERAILFCFVSMQFREIVLDFYHRMLQCSSNLISMLSRTGWAAQMGQDISTSRVIFFFFVIHPFIYFFFQLQSRTKMRKVISSSRTFRILGNSRIFWWIAIEIGDEINILGEDIFRLENRLKNIVK